MSNDFTKCKRCGHVRAKHAPPQLRQSDYGRCGQCGQNGCMEFWP